MLAGSGPLLSDARHGGSEVIAITFDTRSSDAVAGCAGSMDR